MIMADLTWLREVDPKLQSMPPPEEDPAAWEAFIKSGAQRWKKGSPKDSRQNLA